MPPGQQVNPVDQWVGTAGRKLAQYENERDALQRRLRDDGRKSTKEEKAESKRLKDLASTAPDREWP